MNSKNKINPSSSKKSSIRQIQKFPKRKSKVGASGTVLKSRARKKSRKISLKKNEEEDVLNESINPLIRMDESTLKESYLSKKDKSDEEEFEEDDEEDGEEEECEEEDEDEGKGLGKGNGEGSKQMLGVGKSSNRLKTKSKIISDRTVFDEEEFGSDSDDSNEGLGKVDQMRMIPENLLKNLKKSFKRKFRFRWKADDVGRFKSSPKGDFLGFKVTFKEKSVLYIVDQKRIQSLKRPSTDEEVDTTKLHSSDAPLFEIIDIPDGKIIDFCFNQEHLFFISSTKQQQNSIKRLKISDLLCPLQPKNYEELPFNFDVDHLDLCQKDKKDAIFWKTGSKIVYIINLNLYFLGVDKPQHELKTQMQLKSAFTSQIGEQDFFAFFGESVLTIYKKTELDKKNYLCLKKVEFGTEPSIQLKLSEQTFIVKRNRNLYIIDIWKIIRNGEKIFKDVHLNPEFCRTVEIEKGLENFDRIEKNSKYVIFYSFEKNFANVWRRIEAEGPEPNIDSLTEKVVIIKEKNSAIFPLRSQLFFFNKKGTTTTLKLKNIKNKQDKFEVNEHSFCLMKKLKMKNIKDHFYGYQGGLFYEYELKSGKFSKIKDFGGRKSADTLAADKEFLYLLEDFKTLVVYSRKKKKDNRAFLKLNFPDLKSVSYDKLYLYVLQLAPNSKRTLVSVYSKKEIRKSFKNFRRSRSSAPLTDLSRKRELEIEDRFWHIIPRNDFIHLLGYSHRVIGKKKMLEGHEKILDKFEIGRLRSLTKIYYLSEKALYKLVKKGKRNQVAEVAENFKFENFVMDNKRNIAFIIAKSLIGERREIHLFNTSPFGNRNRPFYRIEIGLEVDRLAIQKEILMLGTPSMTYSYQTGWISKHSLIDLSLENELVNHTWRSLQSQINLLTQNETITAFERIIQSFDLLYPSFHVSNSGLLELIFYYSSDSIVVEKYLDTFGLDAYNDQMMRIVNLVYRNKKNGLIQQNFITYLNYLKNNKVPLVDYPIRTSTFFRIAMYEDFKNADVVNFFLHYLRFRVGSYEGEVRKTGYFLSEEDMKGNIIKVTKEEVKDVQKRMFKDRNDAMTLRSHEVHLSMFKLSLVGGVKESSILFEFLSRLRDRQLPEVKPIIDQKFRKFKPFHISIFLFYLAYTISLNTYLFWGRNNWVFPVAIGINIILIVYEILCLRFMGLKNYFKFNSNKWDVILLPSTLVLLFLNRFVRNGRGTFDPMLILAYCNMLLSYLVNIRCIFYLKVFDGLRTLIDSIRAIVSKAGFFIFLLFSYVLIVVVMLQAKEDIDELREMDVRLNSSIYDKFLYSVKLALGDIVFPMTQTETSFFSESATINHDWLNWALIISNGVIVVTMLLNLLIGVLSNAFDNYAEVSKRADLKIKLEMIKEADSFMAIMKGKPMFNHPRDVFEGVQGDSGQNNKRSGDGF